MRNSLVLVYGVKPRSHQATRHCHHNIDGWHLWSLDGHCDGQNGLHTHFPRQCNVFLRWRWRRCWVWSSLKVINNILISFRSDVTFVPREWALKGYFTLSGKEGESSVFHWSLTLLDVNNQIGSNDSKTCFLLSVKVPKCLTWFKFLLAKLCSCNGNGLLSFIM